MGYIFEKMSMKKSFIGLFIFILVVFTIFPVLAQGSDEDVVDLWFFYGKGCSHCAKMERFLDELQEKYPDTLKIQEYETYFNQKNRELFEAVSEAYGEQIEGVPTIFLNDLMIVGYARSLEEKIEGEVAFCVEEGCVSPEDKLVENGNGDVTSIIEDSSPTDDPGATEFKKRVTIPAVIGAAGVDAINPCAFAVLILLITTILAIHNKRKALFSGLAFSAAIYISYFLMGVGLYSAIQAAKLTRVFFVIVAVLAILVGLFNLKDYLWYGKWFVMEVPKTWRPRMKALIKGVTSVPGAFIIGVLISLYLLPCTSGPYIVILGLLAETTTRDYAIGLLLLYNLIFIIPMLVITFAIAFGLTTSEKAEEWRQRKLKILHLIAGIIILLLGIAMFIGMGLGYI